MQRLKQYTILVATCVGLTVATNAWSKDKAPACAYRETALPAPEEAPNRSRIVVTATMPAEGEAVHPNTVIGIDVEYHVADFETYLYETIVHFAEFIPTNTKTVDTRPSESFLSQAHGTVHLCVPIGGLYREENIRWPLQMHVSLQKRTGERSSLLYAESRRVAFPSPDISAKVQQRQKLAPPEHYYLALSSAWAFHLEYSAIYRACVERFPEMTSTHDVPYRQWEERNASLFAQLDTLQLETHAEMSRGTADSPAQRLEEARGVFSRYLDSQSDLSLRNRCEEVLLVLTGEPREFIGRYLSIVNDYVASRPAPKATNK